MTMTCESMTGSSVFKMNSLGILNDGVSNQHPGEHCSLHNLPVDSVCLAETCKEEGCNASCA